MLALKVVNNLVISFQADMSGAESYDGPVTELLISGERLSGARMVLTDVVRELDGLSGQVRLGVCKGCGNMAPHRDGGPFHSPESCLILQIMER